MKPLNPATPAQIGDVTNVDRMDSIDRAKLDPQIKFHLLCAEAKATHGRDPRSGGFAFVARPRVLLQLLKDLSIKSQIQSIIRLQRAVVLGTHESDVLGWWMDVSILVRCTVRDDQLWVVPIDRIPESKPVDRATAGRLRMGAHYGKLDEIGDN